MKQLLLGLQIMIVLTSVSSYAVPGSMKLVKPSKIEIVSDEKIKITVKLPCKNEWALDWSTITMSSDDSGDQSAAVGVIVSNTRSVCGPSKNLKEFVIEINPADFGYPTNTTYGYEPMDLED